MYAIYRCKPSLTLELARTLRSLCVDAWAPVKIKRVKLPRSKGWQKRSMPVLPGFIFAPEGQPFDLPKDMSPMKVPGNAAARVSLAELRVFARVAAEEDLTEAAVVWSVGELVQVNLPVFSHITWVIEAVGTDFATISHSEARGSIVVSLSALQKL